MEPALIRDRETLKAWIKEGNVPKWLFFWGHAPSKDGTVTKSCFSQWWEGAPFELGGETYLTAEHYMMAEKARLFGDSVTRQEILASTHPRSAKMLGRKVRDFDEAVWRRVRINIVVRANVAKFSQHAALREFLINTGDRVLVEASPRDQIWGIGLGKDSPKSQDPTLWRGMNLLGFALMEVREKLRGAS